MEKVLDFWTMDISVKFKTEKQAKLFVNRLEDKFRNILENNKDYKVQAVIGASCLNGKRVIDVYSKGRKRFKSIDESEQAELFYASLYKDWHIHLLVLSQPKEMVRRMIKDYIDKNWSNDINIRAYKKDADVDMIFYISNQCSIMRYVGAEDKRFKYSLKKLYVEYIKVNNAKRKSQYYIYDEDNFLRNKAECRFNDMLNYFRGITSERQKAMQKGYMKKARIRKIAEKYERVYGMVQKNMIDVDVKDVFIARD